MLAAPARVLPCWRRDAGNSQACFFEGGRQLSGRQRHATVAMTPDLEKYTGARNRRAYQRAALARQSQPLTRLRPMLHLALDVVAALAPPGSRALFVRR